MGKTTTTLAAFEVLREQEYAKKMLVVAPIKPMYGTWKQEATKWDDFNHLTFTILHGAGKQNRLLDDVDVYLINPEGLAWFFAQEDRPTVEVLCIDESTKFKNANSKRSKLLQKHYDDFYYRWILTGTITPQGLEDLFGQVRIMDAGVHLGKYITHFRNKYFQSTGFGGYTYTPLDGAVEDVAEKIAHMVLKLDAEDYLNMPDFMKVIRPVVIPAESMRIYKQVEKEFIMAMTGGNIVAANAAAAGTKCRQIANGAVYGEDQEVIQLHDAKLEALEEIVEETNGAPLLVLYEFVHDRDKLMANLKDAVCITGVTGTKLERIIDKFNRGDIPFLVAHPGSTHGLNIQGYCNHMVWYGITWNLEHYIQTVWRLYRQGQEAKMVMCYLLVASNTLDEKVVSVLEHKEAVQENVENLLMQFGEQYGQ